MTTINPGNSNPTPADPPPGFQSGSGEVNLQNPQVRQYISGVFKDFFTTHLSTAAGDKTTSNPFDDGPPAPGDATARGDLNEVYARFEAGGDTFEVGITQIMELLHEIAREEKKAATELRGAEREREFNAHMDAADKKREAAKMALAAGVVSGATKIGSGLVQVGSSVGGAALAGKALKTHVANTNATTPAAGATANGPPVIGAHRAPAGTPAAGTQPATQPGGTVSPAQNQFRVDMLKADSFQGAWKGAAQVGSGLGDIGEAALKYAEAEVRAQESELEAQATVHRYQAEEMQELKQSAIELAREVRQKLGEINEINNRTMNRILQG